jgi:hypothetical protein
MPDPTQDDARTAPATAVRRFASWLRRGDRPGPSPSLPPDAPAPPPSGLRPQPEDDASVYPLF